MWVRNILTRNTANYKAVCVLNSDGQTFVPGGCMLLYDSLFWNEAFTPTLLPPSFTFRKGSACFYLFSLLFFPPLRFSLQRLGIGFQSQIPTLIPAGCLGLSARARSQLDSTKVFPLPGLKIVFASVPHLASILQLLKVLFLQPNLMLYLVPKASPFIPFGAPKPPCFALGSWDTEQVGKCLCKAHVVGGRREPYKGSRSFLCLCFMEGKNQAFFSWTFLCLVFLTAQQKGFRWPGSWEDGLRWSAEVVSISWGCQNTPEIESSCSKRCETQWSCVGLALLSFKWSDHLNM